MTRIRPGRGIARLKLIAAAFAALFLALPSFAPLFASIGSAPAVMKCCRGKRVCACGKMAASADGRPGWSSAPACLGQCRIAFTLSLPIPAVSLGGRVSRVALAAANLKRRSPNTIALASSDPSVLYQRPPPANPFLA